MLQRNPTRSTAPDSTTQPNSESSSIHLSDLASSSAPSTPYRQPSIHSEAEERTLKNRIRLLTSNSLSRHPSLNMSLHFVGSPDFQSPSPGRHHTPRRSRSRATSLAGSVEQRLSVIEEDQPSQPHPPLAPIQEPVRTHHRPFHQRFGLGEPPQYKRGLSPPRYTFWDNVKGPKGEKFEDLRNNAYIASRGGWKRLCLIIWLVLVASIALAIGLGVGLTQRNKSNSTPAPATSTSTPVPENQPFPAGTYSLITYLKSVRTNCTSSSNSWTCQPAQTYSSSPSGSKAQFNWIISPSSDKNDDNFTISSTNNPFSIDFDSANLQLLDQGMQTERYTFQTTVPKIVYPGATFALKCFYNSTLLSANLYTKKAADAVPAEAATSAPLLRVRATDDQEGGRGGGSTIKEWPHAIDVTQSIGGGTGVPDCYEYDPKEPGSVGKRVEKGFEAKTSADFCSCGYANWDL